MINKHSHGIVRQALIGLFGYKTDYDTIRD